MFWPLAGQQAKAGPTKPYKTSSKPMHAKPDTNYDDTPGPDSWEWEHEHRAADWPECWGSCEAGKCVLDKRYPGCCYLSTSSHQDHADDDNNSGYGDGSPHDGDRGSYSYKGHSNSRGERVCWP